MALTGYLQNNFRTGYRLLIEWSAAQNITNNQSTITAKLFLVSTGSGYSISSSADKDYRIAIDGQTFSGKVKINLSGNEKKLLATHSKTINHNADGTRTFAISGYLYMGINFSSGYTESVTIASQSFALDTIPRATTPTLSASSVQAGSAVTINLPRASTAFKHRIFYRWGTGAWVRIDSTEPTTSYTWDTPLSLCNSITNATSRVLTIGVDTYNGSTMIGTKMVNLTISVPSTVAPTISALTLTGVSLYNGYYVQGKSKIKVDITAAGAYGSTIASRETTVKAGSALITSSNQASFTTGFISNTGTITIATTVTDSRGRKATSSKTVTVTAYTAPRITAFNAFRCNASGVEDPNGAYMRLTGTASITSLGSTNTKSTKIEYKLKSASAWTVAASNTDSYTPSLAVTVAADINSQYDVRMTVADYYTSTSQIKSISTAFTLLDFRSTGKGMAVGKVSEKDAFEVGMPTILKSTTVDGVLTANGVAIGNGNVMHGYTVYTGGTSEGILVDTGLTIAEPGMVTLYIKGNGYASGVPIDTIVQGYWYTTDKTFLHCKQLNSGKPISACKFFMISDKVHVFIPSTGEYNTVRISGHTQTGAILSTTVTRSTEPTSYSHTATCSVSNNNIEFGSNANGCYTRFPDGTVICYHRMNLTYSTVSILHGTWTLPTTVIHRADNLVIVSKGANNAGKILDSSGLGGEPSSATAAYIRAFSGNGLNYASTDTLLVRLLFIGRWK